MLKGSYKKLFVIFVTLMYGLYFHQNHDIIPYTRPTVQDTQIIFTHYIYIFPEKDAEPVKAAAVDEVMQATEVACSLEAADCAEDGQTDVGRFILDGIDSSACYTVASASTLGGSLNPVQQPAAGGGGRGDSQVLLSGSGTASAISSLSLNDKLWLVKILSRCSLEELLQIKDMLADGVTYEENLAMYRMLSGKVTDEEQRKLDTLIESYTK